MPNPYIREERRSIQYDTVLSSHFGLRGILSPCFVLSLAGVGLNPASCIHEFTLRQLLSPVMTKSHRASLSLRSSL